MSTKVKNQMPLTQIDSSNGSLGSLVNIGKVYLMLFNLTVQFIFNNTG